jgi:DNA-binding MarR family transcriptional regulator
MEYDQNKLEIAFLVCLRRLRRSRFSEIYRSLSDAEFFTLMAIRTLEEEQQSSVRIASLAERLNTSSPAISKMLRTLEQKSYCKRITDPSNRRSTFVVITEEGDALLREARQNIGVFAKRVSEKMGEDDLAEFIRLSQKCYDAMNEAVAELETEGEEST